MTRRSNALRASGGSARWVGIAVLLAAVAAAAAAGSTQAARSVRPSPTVRHTGGYVPAHGVGRRLGSGNLIYHGGPVMRTNKTYAIYWIPSGYSVSPNYVSLINRYFTDVAADGGSNQNVYSVETQYYDGTGPIAYSSTFGGYTIDTTPFPANAYSSCGGPPKCLSDTQLVTEINNVVAAQGWVKNLTTQFFIFTPKNVGSCDAPGDCSYSVFCAYHGYAGGLIYANQPYAAAPGCDTDHPNGDDADATINVASHEHREAINDEHLDAWYDSAGYEGSDKCAWIFGAALGGSVGSRYNQIINGHHYWLQEEWSNAGSTCLQRYGSAGSPPTVTSFSPTSGPVGTSVSISGTNFTGATAVGFNGTAATSFTVNSATSITATVPSGATSGPISVTTPNGTGTSAASFTVTGGGGGSPPTVTSFSPTRGYPGTVVTINGANFTGATSVKLGSVTAAFTVVSSMQIRATVPSSLRYGFFKWQVTTPGGTATSTGYFWVL